MREPEKGPTYPYIIVQIGVDVPLPFHVQHAITGKIYSMADSYQGAQDDARFWKARETRLRHTPVQR